MILNACKFFIDSEPQINTLAYYAHLVPLGISLVLSLFVIFRKKFSNVSLSFFYLTIAVSLWLFSDLVLWTSSDYYLVHALWGTLDFINITAFIFAVLFFDAICFEKTSFKKKIGLLLLAMPAFFISAYGYAVTAFNQPFCESFENEYMTYYKIFAETICILLIISTYFKFKSLPLSQKPKTETGKIISYTSVFFALILFLVTFSGTEYLASKLDVYVISLYGLFALPIFLLAIIISISRQNLFKLNAYRQQVFAYILLIVVSSQLLFLKNTTDLTLNILTIIIAGTLVVYLNKNIKREILDKERINELNIRLKALDRQKTEFVSLASHQLRAPMTAIKGYVTMMLEGDYGPVPEKFNEPVKKIFSSTQSLIQIVGDFLDVTRIELGTMKFTNTDFDLKQLLEQTIGELRPNITMSQLEFKFEAPQEAFPIQGDVGKLKQVFNNLIDNALKYTKVGWVHVSLEKQGALYRFKVRDNGVGIHPDTVPKLFEKFIRAGNANEANVLGTGLGLYVAKQMILKHNGRIWAESEGEGKGSTFVVELQGK